jgi:glutamate N-acetyltransferase/amino-acid N-acetyltransferase
MSDHLTVDLNGTATSPRGFRAAGVACGIKASGRPDLALLVSDYDCAAAGVFTRNQVVAAPVMLDRATLAADNSAIRGVVINAGNANACTGAPGLANAATMQKLAAEKLDQIAAQFLVLSTGVIGVQLPMTRVQAGITAAAAELDEDGGAAAAQAIMTTDTRPKHCAVTVELAGGPVTIGGMAKGAAMIHPNMATLLGMITTDAAVPADKMTPLLRHAVDHSFNAITIDGDTSTNDTILFLANGASGTAAETRSDLALVQSALLAVCQTLAKMVVQDGEGATKFVEVQVTGAFATADAHQIANTIATSPLVKTAFTGSDPNWGRILMAAGRSGIPLKQSLLSLWIGVDAPDELQLVAAGTPTGFAEADAAAVFAAPAFALRLDLGLGDAAFTVWTTDLSHDYVSLNADYRT